MLNTILLIIILLAMAFVAFLLLICPQELGERLYAPFIGRAYAHRGLHSQTPGTPENSLAAFCEAVASGYGVELDIRLSRDGQVVVFHDERLTRLCDDGRAVADLDYSELRKLQLDGTEEHIPLFSEVLAVIGGKVPLIVELKTCRERDKLAALTAELLDGYTGAYCVESFDPLLLRAYAKLRPEVMRGQLACKMKKDGAHSPVSRLVLSSLMLNFISRPHFIAYRHEDMKNFSYVLASGFLKGFSAAWTVRTQEDFDRLAGRQCELLIFEGFRPEPVIKYPEEDSGKRSVNG